MIKNKYFGSLLIICECVNDDLIQRIYRYMKNVHLIKHYNNVMHKADCKDIFQRRYLARRCKYLFFFRRYESLSRHLIHVDV